MTSSRRGSRRRWANTCAAPRARRTWRDLPRRSTLSRSLRSTRGSTVHTAGDSTGGGGGDGERGEEVNPWGIRREAGLALWNLTAPNETGRAGASSNDHKNTVESSKESRRARRDRRRACGDDPGRVRRGEVLDPEPTSPRTATRIPTRPSGSARGRSGRSCRSPRRGRSSPKHPLAGVAVRSALLRATDPVDPAPWGITPTAVRLLLNATASEEMCEFIGGGRRVPGRRAEGDREWGTVQRQRGGGARQGGENQRVGVGRWSKAGRWV